MDRRILKFLHRQFIMSLSTISDSGSWSANLFYAYSSEYKALIFTSSADSRHIVEALKNPEVSIAIYRTSMRIASLRGAQILGELQDIGNNAELIDHCQRLFRRRFPLVLGKLSDMWMVKLKEVKYTDNRLGFGSKIYWKGQSY